MCIRDRCSADRAAVAMAEGVIRWLAGAGCRHVMALVQPGRGPDAKADAAEGAARLAAAAPFVQAALCDLQHADAVRLALAAAKDLLPEGSRLGTCFVIAPEATQEGSEDCHSGLVLLPGGVKPAAGSNASWTRTVRGALHMCEAFQQATLANGNRTATPSMAPAVVLMSVRSLAPPQRSGVSAAFDSMAAAYASLNGDKRQAAVISLSMASCGERCFQRPRGAEPSAVLFSARSPAQALASLSAMLLRRGTNPSRCVQPA
eukprot:695846-Pyramimonas_sp.AAC.1